MEVLDVSSCTKALTCPAGTSASITWPFPSPGNCIVVPSEKLTCTLT